jgi:cytochrome b-561
MSAIDQVRRLGRKAIWPWSPESERESSEAIVRNLWLHWFPAKVARASLDWNYSFWLGTASAALLLILTVTGVMLMFFYVPSTERAYASIKDLQFAVSFGRLLRNQHRWAAEGMVAVVFIHMARVFFTGAYRGPRAANWVVGILLFLATLLLSFTGYLLPWDQLAFWAITVGTSIARQAPLVGPTIQLALLGGHEIGQQTLLRFYVLHVFFLPAFVWILFAYHMWRVRKDGGLAAVERLRHEREMAPKAMPTTKSYSLFGLTPGTSIQVMSSTGLEEDDQVFSSPNVTRRIALVFLVVFNLTLLAALLFDAPLEGLANPAVTPNPAKAPWYFVWLQELVASTTLHLGPLTVSGAFLGGILIPGFLLIVLTIWPWLDRSPKSAEGRWFPPERRRQNAVFIVATFAIVVLIIIGVYLRGPYWRIYWPGQVRPEMPRLY